MKFAAAVFWWQHRRRLKALGYSLSSFCALTSTYWRNLMDGGFTGTNDGFARNQLRARW
jgi:hypothetical protein